MDVTGALDVLHLPVVEPAEVVVLVLEVHLRREPAVSTCATLIATLKHGMPVVLSGISQCTKQWMPTLLCCLRHSCGGLCLS